MKGHAHQNNNNVSYDDETGKDSEKKKILTHQESNRSFIADVQRKVAVATTYETC